MIKEELFRFAKFTGSSLIGGTVDMVLVIDRIFSCNLVVTNLIGRLLAGLLNYVISDKVIFKKDVK